MTNYKMIENETEILKKINSYIMNWSNNMIYTYYWNLCMAAEDVIIEVRNQYNDILINYWNDSLILLKNFHYEEADSLKENKYKNLDKFREKYEKTKKLFDIVSYNLLVWYDNYQGCGEYFGKEYKEVA